MARFLREFSIIALLTCIGAAFSLFSGLAPLPWAEPALAAGEIQLVDARALDVVWVDARSEADYNADHIAEAMLLNDDNWETGVVELMGAWLMNPRPIIVYCGSESCGTSKRIADRLREALPDAEIYSLKGGWDAWLQ
ncbi:MAG: rhodanese-related sulfurtransferase [Lentimonas sp.]|jgi:rhodanese-related sulfurtransferase